MRVVKRVVTQSVMSAGVVSLLSLAAAAPVEMTAEQDHARTMKMLGIESLRPGPSGNPSAPNAANSDESKATPYTSLPDPLVMDDGTKVTTPEQWTKRRAEIAEHFDREIYGRVPANVPGVKWEVVKETKGENGGVATVTKQLVGHVDNSSYPDLTVEIAATLTTPLAVPASAAGKVPVVVEFGFSFPNRRPTTGAGAGASRPAMGALAGGGGFGQPPGPTWQQQVLAQGWGYCILTPTSYQADNGAGLTKGIIGLCNKGQPRGIDDWGALRAWAWGASRLVDYLETDPNVDGNRLAIEGLSRYGKATLVTMAYEPRFSLAFVGSSGQGGAKIARRLFGEQVENVASSGEYHWMAPRYLKYAGPLTPNDMPVDSHELVALCAPRPVFVSVGSLNVEGKWIDANGNFLGAALASPVYELLGKKGLGATTIPEEKVALISGDIAFRMHEGGHTTGPNWPTFIEWAKRYWK